MPEKEVSAFIFDIEDFATQDGPGIRTVIFFKGCSLRCSWCSNPESQNNFPEILHSESLCKKCGKCIEICPYNAVAFNENGALTFNRDFCLICKNKPCVTACNNDAIRIAGIKWKVDDLFNKVIVNSQYFSNSGGGITLSGGEPLFQPEFVKAFLTKCTQLGLSVGLETCGYFKWDQVKDFITDFDFIYFDIKCLDDELSKKYTGQSSRIILQNLENLARTFDKRKIILSLPLIPEITATEENILSLIELCKKLGISTVRLLPYHTLGKGKYAELGREYKMKDDVKITDVGVRDIQQVFENENITCIIEGF
ncbi:glycyl-radical enzyme activating protein [bacterium]|nr:MAG: glycyl-radical enzyme activating protein [bacterium]